MLCCFSQISSRASKAKRLSIKIKKITMPKTYKKAKSAGVGGMYGVGTNVMLIYTKNGAK